MANSYLSKLCVESSESGLTLQAKFQQLEQALTRHINESTRKKSENLQEPIGVAPERDDEPKPWESFDVNSVEVLLDQCEAYKEQLSSFQASVQTFVTKQEAERKFWENERSGFLSTIKELEQQIQAQAQQLGAAQIELENYTEENSELKANFEQFKSSSTTEIAALQDRLRELQDTVSMTLEEMVLVQNECSKLREENVQLRTENLNVKNYNLSLSESVATSNAESKLSNQKIVHLETKNCELVNYKRDAELKIDELGKLQLQMKEKFENKQDENDQLIEVNKQLRCESETLQQELGNVQNAMSHMQLERDELLAQNERLRALLQAESSNLEASTSLEEMLVMQRRYLVSKYLDPQI